MGQVTAFAEQRLFLRSSAQAFDDGIESEAKRLASAAYVLLHDGAGRTVSLMTQLGHKATKFLSTSTFHKDDGKSIRLPSIYVAGIAAHASGRAVLFPFCYFQPPKEHLPKRWLSFNDWWNEVVFQEAVWHPKLRQHKVGRTLTRKNLVFHLRTQDNGSHFDGELQSEIYTDLAVRKRIGMYRVLPNGESAPLKENPHLVAMRQIAWEIEESLSSIPGGPAGRRR